MNQISLIIHSVVKSLAIFCISVIFVVVLLSNSLSSVSSIDFPHLRFYESHSTALKTIRLNYKSKKFNHPYSGRISSLDACDDSPSNNRQMKSCLHIGRGYEIFLKASQIIESFQMVNSLTWAKLIVDIPNHCVGGQRGSYNDCNAATLVKCYGLIWTLNPCRIVSHVFDQSFHSPHSSQSPIKKYSQICYSTLQGHLMAGEERFRVTLDANDDVHFELFSYARGAGVLGKLCMPLIKPLQYYFFKDVTHSMNELMKQPLS